MSPAPDDLAWAVPYVVPALGALLVVLVGVVVVARGPRRRRGGWRRP